MNKQSTHPIKLNKRGGNITLFVHCADTGNWMAWDSIAYMTTTDVVPAYKFNDSFTLNQAIVTTGRHAGIFVTTVPSVVFNYVMQHAPIPTESNL